MSKPELPDGAQALPEPLCTALRPAWETAVANVPALPVTLAEAAGLRGEAARILALSPFVARYAATAAFQELIHSGDLERAYGPQEYARRMTELRDIDDESAFLAALRRLRMREMVRIAWRDLAGRADLAATMAELSAFADAALEGTLVWLERALEPAIGVPCDAQGRAQRLVILAMGKLGAGELNFSSDIDLIFAYPAEGETRAGRRTLSNHEYFNRLGQRLIKALAQMTPDGFVFRVDMRLRPFGESGALTLGFDAMFAYFEVHARDWERYAMIKARAAAGDVDAGETLLRRLQPFVFRRYLDFSALEALRDMKRLIAEEVARQGLEDDVKRGAGGIREIEFIGQSFQIIRGGREPALRDRRIQFILAQLGALGHLPPATCATLLEAYEFLRRTEHRLQEIDDRQTHELPTDELGRLRLAQGMGYGDWEAFATELYLRRDAVSMHFDRLLGVEPQADTTLADFASVWDADLDTGQIAAALAGSGFADADAVAAEITRLRAQPHVRRLGRNGRARLARLMPRLLAAVRAADAPAVTLGRIFELVDAVAQRSVYLALLADHEAALAQLVRLCAASPWIAAQIVRQPILLDELLDPRVLYDPPGCGRLQAQMAAALARHGSEDLEQGMDTLRQFRHVQVLRVAAADVGGDFPIAQVSNHLSDIAEVVIESALTLGERYLVARHGQPLCRDDGVARRAGFAVIAYGKLGGLELGYGSDLDLVFLYDGRGARQETDGERPIDNATFFTRLAQRVIHLLETATAAGRAYQVDTRLRPSGASGLLVSTLDAYRRYQLEDAWTWEHQALVRARCVAGAASVCSGFGSIRREVLGRTRDPHALRDDVVAMRERMRAELTRREPGCFDIKQGEGGITDIEFMVQYAVLRWASAHPELLVWTDNLRLLETIAAARLLPAADCRILHDAYFAYRAVVHRLSLQGREALVEDASFGEHREGVRRVWERVMKP
ncbi:MAG: bifunctional [glutamate--ammonia ligase]-adenylyl-L-tyrosine phosphorylase/[glutamate--ammonia-ligase] adenylyltransferase [Gammaproteobacteria bacterium]|nr:bifunctional [glutamate--ammonia ligase]-adenylyl-L-tyrosine phosphorylase/[glutamate--ammonia-ligase] adenylyltransferase [Gammaproteobacteria bacterium]